MAKFCVNCGSELIEGARACGNCGTMIEGNTPSVDNTSNSIPNNGNNIPNNGGTVNVNVNQVPKKNTDIGVIGFWISLVSTILCCGSFNFISLVLCIIGLVDSKNNPGNNKGLAIAGIVISSVGFIVAIIGYFLSAVLSYM